VIAPIDLNMLGIIECACCMDSTIITAPKLLDIHDWKLVGADHPFCTDVDPAHPEDHPIESAILCPLCYSLYTDEEIEICGADTADSEATASV
jgi:hypothetical protein